MFRRSSSDDQFVVHRGRGIPTLSSVVQAEEPLVPARLRPTKEKQNQDSKAEERGEPIAAGRPSNWEDSRRSSYAGRRSRRNSISDDSQVVNISYAPKCIVIAKLIIKRIRRGS